MKHTKPFENALRERAEARVLQECARRLTLEQQWAWILRGAGALSDGQIDAVFRDHPELALVRPLLEELRAAGGRGPWADRPIMQSESTMMNAPRFGFEDVTRDG